MKNMDLLADSAAIIRKVGRVAEKRRKALSASPAKR
jgi:hypothetical protein